MALTLVDTAGAANANTYASLAYAEAYMETRLHKSAWSAAISADKNIALVMATRGLDDLMDWKGTAASVTQALLWPRFGVLDRKNDFYDSDEIPASLKKATAEYAYFLLSTDWTKDDEAKGIRKIKADVIEVVFDKTDRKKRVPESVLNMVRHLGIYIPSSSMQTLVRC